MQAPTERHLKRRQNYFVFILQDIIYHAYQRAHHIQPTQWPKLDTADYTELFTVATSDISQIDNGALAIAAKDMTAVFKELATQFPTSSKLKRFMLQTVLKFAGEAQRDDFLDEVMAELDTTARTTQNRRPNQPPK